MSIGWQVMMAIMAWQVRLRCCVYFIQIMCTVQDNLLVRVILWQFCLWELSNWLILYWQFVVQYVHCTFLSNWFVIGVSFPFGFACTYKFCTLVNGQNFNAQFRVVLPSLLTIFNGSSFPITLYEPCSDINDAYNCIWTSIFAAVQ